MNARIDAWLIPNGICAWDMEVAHYMNGSCKPPESVLLHETG